MLPFFFKNSGTRLSQQEKIYFSQLMPILKEHGPSECWVKFLVCLRAVGGFFPGFLIGNWFCFIFGGLAGSCYGLWKAKEHDRMLASLKSLSEGEKVRIVALVQGVVGGSSDINQVVEFIKSCGSRTLLKALKQNLKTNLV